jgi:hypothetical protein
LERYSGCGRSCNPFFVEICSFLQSEEPDKCTDDDDPQAVQQEHVIGNDQADSDVVALDDSENRDQEGEEECHTQDNTR